MEPQRYPVGRNPEGGCFILIRQIGLNIGIWENFNFLTTKSVFFAASEKDGGWKRVRRFAEHFSPSRLPEFLL